MTETEDKFEVRSSHFPYEMSGWCSEKSGKVAEYIARLIEMIQTSALSDDERERFRFLLGCAAWDATKLMSFATGSDWSPDDARQLQTEGFAGYQEVAVRYGIIRETDKQRGIRKLNEFLREVEPLVRGQQAPNRTLIHELLGRTQIKHPFVTMVADEIEKVTMDRHPWTSFQKAILAEMDIVKQEAS